MARAAGRRLLWALTSVPCEFGLAWTPATAAAAAAAAAAATAAAGGAASPLQHRAWPLVQRWLSTSAGTADAAQHTASTSGQQQAAATGLPPSSGGGFVLSPGDRSEAAVSLRTRAVMAALQASEQPLSSHQLYDRVREMFPDAGISSRHHFKQLIKRLRDCGWVKPRPGKSSGFEFTLTELGKQQPLEGAPKSRHLRLAEEQAARILAAQARPAGGSVAGSTPNS